MSRKPRVKPEFQVVKKEEIWVEFDCDFCLERGKVAIEMFDIYVTEEIPEKGGEMKDAHYVQVPCSCGMDTRILLGHTFRR